MATSSCKALGRLSFRLQSLVHNTNTKQSSLSLNLKLKPQSATVPRVSLTSRSESLLSLSHLPNHSFYYNSNLIILNHFSSILLIRLPVELSSLESMLPFYSAVASARLVSSLSIESLGWGLVPQGAFFSH